MRTIPLLALAALLAPGCAFARRAVPLDPSGMAYPLRCFGGTLREQSGRSADLVTGMPRRLSRHGRECWRNLTTDTSGS